MKDESAISKCQEFSQKAVAFLITDRRRNNHGLSKLVDGGLGPPALPLDPAFGQTISSQVQLNRLLAFEMPHCIASITVNEYMPPRVQMIL